MRKSIAHWPGPSGVSFLAVGAVRLNGNVSVSSLSSVPELLYGTGLVFGFQYDSAVCSIARSVAEFELVQVFLPALRLS